MNFIKIFLVNGFLIVYLFIILWTIISPKGIIKEIQSTYKKVYHIKKNQERLKKKNEYYNFLIKEAKNGDGDTMAFLFFFKFNHPMKGYTKIIPLKKNQ